MEDDKIIELLWNREEQGLRELKNKYGNHLKQLSERMLSIEDAEECVSDTYIAVWNSIPPQRPQYLHAYISKICRNISLNKVEWNHAAKRNVQVFELSQELEQCIPDKSNVMDARELGNILSAFLYSLPDEKRIIFIRRYWYGDSIKELAQYYGYRNSKIKSILFRVRKELREYLEKEGVAI